MARKSEYLLCFVEVSKHLLSHIYSSLPVGQLSVQLSLGFREIAVEFGFYLCRVSI